MFFCYSFLTQHFNDMYWKWMWVTCVWELGFCWLRRSHSNLGCTCGPEEHIMQNHVYNADVTLRGLGRGGGKIVGENLSNPPFNTCTIDAAFTHTTKCQEIILNLFVLVLEICFCDCVNALRMT